MLKLRNLAGSFLRQQISTHFNDSETRLERIGKQAKALTGEARTHALARLNLLKSWEQNGREVIPFLLEMLGGKETEV